jgi:hypothetical protein
MELCAKVAQLQLNLKLVDSPSSYEQFETGYSWLADNAVADCTKIKKELNVPLTSLETPLKKTFTWLN